MRENITILNFSGRKEGNCAKIAEFIEQHNLNANIYSYDVGEYYTPCSSCDYECLKEGKDCPSITEDQIKIMDGILQSERTYFVIPNYCGFPCANYFAFNERSVGYFHLDKKRMEKYMQANKKFIIVSNSESDIFYQAMEQQTGTPDILYLKTRKYQNKSTAGDLLTIPAAQAELISFLDR